MTNPPSASEHWAALRACWRDLQDSRLQMEDETESSQDLRRRHAAVLTELVTAGGIEAGVADRISAAFGEAIIHTQRRWVRCYFALPAEFEPREDLTTQAAALAEMASRSEIDPGTIAHAQESLARDIAWLAQFNAGQKPNKSANISVSPIEIKAAQILSELLSGKRLDECAQEGRMMDADAEAENWQPLRACWLALRDPLLEAPQGHELADDLMRRHTDAVTALTGHGLQPDVADRVREAFEEAIAHIRRRMVTCYAVIPAAAEQRGNLVAQAIALAEMAKCAAIEPETIARAQALLQCEIAWLSQVRAGQQPWKQEAVDAAPAVVEAARVLVELLLGRTEFLRARVVEKAP